MSTVAIIGAGVIGLSWAELFHDHGWDVVISDPRTDLADVVGASLGERDIRLSGSVEDAVAHADFVQENGPERIELKREVFAAIAEAAPASAILASSSSSLLPSAIAEGNAAADRVLIGHPFNPPALMPLVELVPGPETSAATMDIAFDVYSSLDHTPVRLKREIRGFVGNRLQKALNDEAYYLVQQGIVDPAGLDTVMKNSLGLRWATVGPFEGGHLGGGPDGIRHLAANVGSQMTFPLGSPDRSRMDVVFDQVETAYGTGPEAYRVRAQRRDRLTRRILDAVAVQQKSEAKR
ncbi:3-hydroxyacyl-CoA dehydrogenase NAD-binding domain-containing protein [Antrihabitans cavernicola]|uniref:Hydroxylacyl-CoA dehydrogenase n=1 Tax=Antrihabitans cavernicola TaxID=2495913 RepID=A0A5A7SB40_9NOCA|nr:3-hydroxyacyl-CoA dehydrogenase NAD-binding domain-containing protein [Spelaeibacter cavernicola]KAA0023360.1 hydroxylacyl-CoA dehydrogenase [Spelaeibacter cavernicola]